MSTDRRSERALDVLSTLGGSEEAARGMTAFFEAQGALGSLAFLTGAGEIWSREQLSRRDRSLVVITFLTALGRDLELQQHVVGGLNHGLTREEVDEIMVQLGPYIGLPSALAGAGVVARAFAALDGEPERSAPPAPAEDRDRAARRRDGLAVLQTLLGLPEGTDMAPIGDSTVEQLGDMGDFVVEYAFGDVWSRPALSRRDRSLIVISALAAQAMEHELGIHLGGALNHGVTATEIEEVMLTLVVYGGFPKAINGIHLARRVLSEREASR